MRNEADARIILASFYFDKDRINDVVETLSMGENVGYNL